MDVTPNKLLDDSGARRQVVSALQVGNNVDAVLTGSMPVRGKGKVKGIFGLNAVTALTGNATHDVVPKRYTQKCGLAKGATTMIPLVAATDLRLDSTNLAGRPERIVPGAETVMVGLLQAPGGANQVKLPAADAQLDGFYCDADIEIVAGLGKGQKNRLTSYATATKIAAVKNIEGTPNWKVATDATSVARITTRRFVADVDDIYVFNHDFTVGTGAAGVDCLAGVEIEFDDSVNV